MEPEKTEKFRISKGTWMAIILLAAVLAGCGLFFGKIAAGNRAELLGDLIKEIPEGEIVMQEPEDTPEPQNDPGRDAAAGSDRPDETGNDAAESVSFTITASGAVYAPQAVVKGYRDASGEYDLRPLFQGIGDLWKDSDLTLCTLETMTYDSDTENAFRAPEALLEALSLSGADMLSLATEQAIESDESEVFLTDAAVHRLGMETVGLTRQPWTELKINGISVAVIGCSYGGTEEDEGCIRRLDADELCRDISAARAGGAKVVIVMPHWGIKYAAEVPEELRAMAARLAEAGADIIFGTHANVVQETERLTVRRGDGLLYDTVVCYGLGSLMTDSRVPENTAGVSVRLDVTYHPESRRITLGMLSCSPLYIACETREDADLYRVVDPEDTEILNTLDDTQRELALQAAEHVREVTGQKRLEEEGEG